MLPPALVRKAAALCAAALCAFALSGCQGIVPSQSGSQVRIIAASHDAPGLDIYQNNAALAYNLGFGTITSYVPIDPGTYTTTATVAGSKQVLSSTKSSFVTATQYTVLIGNSAASLQQLTLKDQSIPAPSGQISLRFIDQATRIAPLDIYLIPAGKKLTDVTPVVTNINFGTNTGYLNIPTGTYTLVMVPTGTVPTSDTVATYVGAQVTYTGGSASTIVLIDQQLVTTPGLQVIIAPDYVSPTATS
jgi:PKD repeat protein